MDDESKISAEQLRLATSRRLAEDATHDGETTALRDAFLALGERLEAAGQQFNEPALLARLKESCVEQPFVAVRMPESRAARGNWPLIVACTLATTAIIAVFAVIALWTPAGRSDVAIAPNRPPHSSRDLSAVESGTRNWIWSDPLDEEIALAQVHIEQLASRSTGVDGSLIDMSQRLQALSQELWGESL